MGMFRNTSLKVPTGWEGILLTFTNGGPALPAARRGLLRHRPGADAGTVLSEDSVVGVSEIWGTPFLPQIEQHPLKAPPRRVALFSEIPKGPPAVPSEVLPFKSSPSSPVKLSWQVYKCGSSSHCPGHSLRARRDSMSSDLGLRVHVQVPKYVRERE